MPQGIQTSVLRMRFSGWRRDYKKETVTSRLDCHTTDLLYAGIGEPGAGLLSRMSFLAVGME
jgi:hypothetical protein